MFEIIGGNSASDLTGKIEKLCEQGYRLGTIHYGKIDATSPLSSSDWFSEVLQEFKNGAQVVAVLVDSHDLE